MYRRVELTPTSPENFEFPSEGKLSPDNRLNIGNSHCYYFFSYQSFHPASAGFLGFFMSEMEKQHFFSVNDYNKL